MARQQHRLHGDPHRFEVLAAFIAERFGRNVRYIADVAGGQGMLSRVLAKKYNYVAEVIDPRGWVLKGVPNRPAEFTADLAEHYDLIVGLHPDEALRPVVLAARVRPVIVVPCCNFWSEERMGSTALVDGIAAYFRDQGIACDRVTMAFAPPKNVALVAEPPARLGRRVPGV